MRFIRLFPVVFLTLAALALRGQGLREEIAADPDKAGGMYYAYTYGDPARTPAPKGYEPFYISHYGRHGSRWLQFDSQYTEMMELFSAADAAKALTPKGREVYGLVKQVYGDGIDRAGSLTPLGVSQHREIAERMYRSYPGVFRGKAVVNAESTVVVRCVISMSAFCERLKELNPALRISREANLRTTRYLEFFYRPINTISPEYLEFLHNGEWKQQTESILRERIDTARIASTLFSEAAFARSTDAFKLVKGLFFFAVGVQNTELDVSFYDLFTPDELYWLDVCENYYYYTVRGPSPLNGSYPQHYAQSLLQQIIARADRAIANGETAADLRFGHDVNLMALLPLMQLDGWATVLDDPEKIAEAWTLHKITPMAANLQMVFYRGKKSGDVLVKFLYNEHEARIPVATDTAPYYRWEDAKAFYLGAMRSAEIKNVNISE